MLRLIILFMCFLNANGMCFAAETFDRQMNNRLELVGSFKRIDNYFSGISMQEITYTDNVNGGEVKANSYSTKKDWPGIKRDMLYFLGYQFAVVGILYVSPESVSEWSDEQKDSASFKKYTNHINKTVWDNDALWINYIMHPYWGGAYYVRARERGYDNVESFWFSALFSAFYEYGAEAIFEYPSIQDLIVTPVGGTYVGQYFMKLRTTIKKRNKTGRYDSLILVLTDPLGAVNEKVDSILGRNIHAELSLAIISPPPPWYQKQGENISSNWLSERGAVPGLSLNIRW